MNKQAAFSLLEVILALAILGATLAVLSSIALTGTDAAAEAADLAAARLLCESKMAEQLLNPEIPPVPMPPTSVGEFDTPDSATFSRFLYSVQILPAAMQGLLAVTVTVNTEELDSVGNPRVSFSLVRWMIDPNLGLAQAEREEAASLEMMSEFEMETATP